MRALRIVGLSVLFIVMLAVGVITAFARVGSYPYPVSYAGN